ncbi:MAG: Fe-S cluster assembly protein SufD [Methylococcaceae bacterium]|nr:Fe-S cluster assembly protein SufD [Methylococcaceae bacterium]
MNAQLASHYSSDYPEYAANLSGQSVAWLKTLRSEALATFSSTGFPTLREEEWRYTNVSAIEKKRFKPVEKTGTINENLLKTYRLDDAWTMVFVDGYFSPEHSHTSGLSDEVELSSIADILETQAEKLKPYLGQAVSNDEHNFVAFNTAWFNDGVFLNIPAKQVLSKPIQLLHIVSQPDALVTTRNIIVAGKHSESEIIETFIGENAYLNAAVNEVFVEENAALTLYKLQSESTKSYHFGGTYVKQQPNSRFNHNSFSFGALLARNDVHTDLETASECSLNGLYLGVKRQHIDNHTRINHNKPHGISREFYKGILDNRARGVFQGRVVVVEDAQKTDSEMNNRNLLLSNDAEVDTKPQLEIYADDVKCAHGVTVGQLEEKSIFYLQSRGVDEETARNVLTFAFANEMVDKVSIDSLKTLLETELLKSLPIEL